jgi:CheY-like chemotaxis protein
MSLLDGERYYHRIPGLLIGKRLSNAGIHININKFIDIVPDLMEKIERDFGCLEVSHRRSNFIFCMEELISLLKDVYARTLESEGVKLLRCINDGKQITYALKNMKPFITDVLSLSVEMQKAQNLEKQKRTESLGKREVLSGRAKNVATVGSLINGGEYGKAQTVTSELVEYIPSENDLSKLLELINGENYEEAKKTITGLISKYEDFVTKLENVDMSKKILAVDDMPEILSFVNNALKNHYKVIAVSSGKTALKVIETQKPDLFILDIDMPEMNGHELAEKIRAIPAHAKTPLVFLTGNATREHVTKAMAVGCNDFLIKPVSHEYLLTKAEKFLSDTN